MDVRQPDLIDRVIEFISFRFDQEIDRWQVIAALCIAVLVILYSGYSLFCAWSARGVQVIATTENGRSGGDAGAGANKGAGGKGSEKSSQWLFVYLCGAVQKPGVYRVGAGTRLNTAIALAGGLAAEADGNAVNMARKVVDGERVYIPKVGEKLSTYGSSEGTGSSESLGDGSGGGTGSEGGAGDSAAGRININKANTAALDTIPGIGPTLASRIIDHRQKRNGFTDIDQLGEVEGIGPKILAKIKPYVFVE